MAVISDIWLFQYRSGNRARPYDFTSLDAIGDAAMTVALRAPRRARTGVDIDLQCRTRYMRPRRAPILPISWEMH